MVSPIFSLLYSLWNLWTLRKILKTQDGKLRIKKGMLTACMSFLLSFLFYIAFYTEAGGFMEHLPRPVAYPFMDILVGIIILLFAFLLAHLIASFRNGIKKNLFYVLRGAAAGAVLGAIVAYLSYELKRALSDAFVSNILVPFLEWFSIPFVYITEHKAITIALIFVLTLVCECIFYKKVKK